MTKIPRVGDHLGWAEYWGDAALRSIENALARPRSDKLVDLDVNTVNYALDLQHVKRCVRLAWYHACRVKNYQYWDPFWTTTAIVDHLTRPKNGC